MQIKSSKSERKISRSVWSRLFMLIMLPFIMAGGGYMLYLSITRYEYIQLVLACIGFGIFALGAAMAYSVYFQGSLVIRKNEIVLRNLLGRTYRRIDRNAKYRYYTESREHRGTKSGELVIEQGGEATIFSLFGMVNKVTWKEKELFRPGKRDKNLARHLRRRDYRLLAYCVVLLAICLLISFSDLLLDEELPPLEPALALVELPVSEVHLDKGRRSSLYGVKISVEGHENFLFKVRLKDSSRDWIRHVYREASNSPSGISMWVDARAYRKKILGEPVELSYGQRHFNYGRIEVQKLLVNGRELKSLSADREDEESAAWLLLALGFPLLSIGVVYFIVRKDLSAD